MVPLAIHSVRIVCMQKGSQNIPVSKSDSFTLQGLNKIAPKYIFI